MRGSAADRPSGRSQSKPRGSAVLPALVLAAALGGTVAIGGGAASAADPSETSLFVLTPAVTDGGVFSDARDTALAALGIGPAVSSDGVFSDARDTALWRLILG